MFSPEEAFVTDFEKLFQIVSKDSLISRPTKTSVHRLLDAVVILRRWLLDQHPLLVQVNRDVRHKIRFPVREVDHEAMEEGSRLFPHRICAHYLSALNSSDKTRALKSDEFLKTPVEWVAGKPIANVREIILYFAHMGGAVHTGVPSTDKEKELQKIFTTIGASVVPAGLQEILPIGRVVVEAAVPIYLKLREGVRAAQRDRRNAGRRRFKETWESPPEGVTIVPVKLDD